MPRNFILIGPLLAAALAAGCAAGKPAGSVIHESPRGAVALEPMPDGRSAAHPIKLQPAAIENVLRGIRLRDRGSVVDKLFTGDTAILAAFSDADIQFLAPLINDALQTARPDQAVRFTLKHADPLRVSTTKTGAGAGSSDSILASRTAVTNGTLYVYGLSLYVTLSDYERRPAPPDTIRGPNRQYADEGGLTNRELFFVPESAVRPDSFKQSGGWLGKSAGTTFAVDYEMLGRMAPAAERTPPAPPRPTAVTAEPQQRALDEAERMSGAPPKAAPLPSGAASVADEELQSVKDLVIKKDMEVEALKKELRELKKQLDNREGQTESQKKKAAKKPSTSSP